MASEGIGNVCFSDARGRFLLVALSGGADSVALICLAHRRRTQDDLRLAAAHFHHGIRGAEADGDLAFCRALCDRLGVELFEGRADVPALARERGVGLETAAREARYAFLEATRAHIGADWIALAHHLDDQAETVLMHLLRGAGPEGARGMARRAGRLYRPLLDVPKAALVQFLEEAGISWREDATNGVSDTPRNALRLNVMPEIEKSYPSAAVALARYARLARIESDFVAKLAERFLAERLETGVYGQRLRLEGDEEEALLRRALRALCGRDAGAEKIDALTVLARANRGRVEIRGGLRAEKTPGWLYFLHGAPKKIQASPLALSGETHLEGLCRVRAEEGCFAFSRSDPRTELFDPASLRGAELRTRRPGDRFHPLGAPGDRLLSDYLTDRKVDRPLRDFWPLVAVGARVLWVCGLGMSETARLRDERMRCVRLTINSITDEKAEVEYEQRHCKGPDFGGTASEAHS